MHQSARPLLAPTVALADQWIDEIARRTGASPRTAFNVLRAGLHALRDRLPAEAAANVARDLPALVRGLWF
jgi:uncharacterized protein (DUF2267 family)